MSGLSSGVVSVAAGQAHTCALLSTGGLKCWGLNASGQIGDGTNTQRLTPVDVSGLTSGVSSLGIAVNANHSCAILGTGAAKCWGANNKGQIGDTTTTTRLTATQVTSITTGATMIAAGALHTCAVVTNGGLKCWGQNTSGQIGDSGPFEGLRHDHPAQHARIRDELNRLHSICHEILHARWATRRDGQRRRGGVAAHGSPRLCQPGDERERPGHGQRDALQAVGRGAREWHSAADGSPL